MITKHEIECEMIANLRGELGTIEKKSVDKWEVNQTLLLNSHTIDKLETKKKMIDN